MEPTESAFSSTPFPGLRPFRNNESDIFFGREEQTDKLLEKLQRTHFVAVIGASGCGKSSLVRAGLLAGLESGFMGDLGHRWRIADMRPGTSPLSRLAEALASPEALDGELGGGDSRLPLIEGHLRRGPLGLVEIVRDARLPERTNLLVLVDQFEEVFRFRRLGDPNTADAFVALLLASAQQREVPIFVVITMRSDFLGDCAVFRGLPEAINESQYLTPRLTRDQIRAAIVGPARVFGGDVDPALANRLINDVGPDPDQLPVLQHALMRMWALALAQSGGTGTVPTIGLQHYEQIGGLSQALSRHADEVLASLPPESQRLAEVMFRGLTERGESRRDTRRPAPADEIAGVAEVPVSELEAVAAAFRAPEVSFVTPAAGKPLAADTVLDISHESLIRLWKRLSEWVEDEARRADRYQALQRSALEWKAGEADPWSGPQLERILAWRAEVNPTAGWARRYGHDADYAICLEFLAASEARQRKERAARDELKRLQKQRAKNQVLTYATVSACSVALAIVAGVAWYKARDAEKEALSRQLALKSGDMLQVDSDLALATAMEALCVKPTDLAENSVARVLAGRRELHRLHPPGDSKVVAVGYTDAGPRAVTRAEDHSIGLWDLESGNPIHRLEETAAEIQAAFSPVGMRLVTYTQDKGGAALRIWDAHDGRPIGSPIMAGAGLAKVALSRAGTRLAAAMPDGTTWFWDTDTGAPIGAPVKPKSSISKVLALAFSPDGERVLLNAQRGEDQDKDVAIVIDPRGGRANANLEQTRPNRYFPWSVAFTPDGARLLTLNGDKRLQLWDASSGRQVTELSKQTQMPRTSVFLPDGKSVIFVNLEGVVRLFDLQNGDETILSEPGSLVDLIDLSSDGTRLATLNQDGSARVLSVSRLLERKPLEGIRSAAFSDDADLAVVGNATGRAYLWNAKTGRVVMLQKQSGRASGPEATMHQAVRSVAFSRTGALVVTAHEDGIVRIWKREQDNWDNWKPENDNPLVIHASDNDRVKCAAFNPDESALVTASEDGTVRLWGSRDGKALSDVLTLGRDEFPLCAAFSQDGKQVFAVSNKGNVWRWETAHPKQQTKPMRVLGRDLTAASIGPDAQTLIGTGTDNGRSVAWIWGKDLASLPTELLNQKLVTNFAAKGKRVGTLGTEHTLTIWDVDSGRAISIFTGEGVAALSPNADRIVVKDSVGQQEVAKMQECRACKEFGSLKKDADTQANSVMQSFKRDPLFQVGNRFACLSAQQTRPQASDAQRVRMAQEGSRPAQ